MARTSPPLAPVFRSRATAEDGGGARGADLFGRPRIFSPLTGEVRRGW